MNTIFKYCEKCNDFTEHESIGAIGSEGIDAACIPCLERERANMNGIGCGVDDGGGVQDFVEKTWLGTASSGNR